MNSFCSSKFWDCYNGLSEQIRDEAKESYVLWCKDSTAKSLYFKPVPNKAGWWSVRATKSHRAVGIKDGEDIVWFFIGNHDDYMRLIG